MERIVIAIADDDLRKSVSDIITKSGIRVRAAVKTGAEAIKTINRMDGGVLVCSPRLKDMPSANLCFFLGDKAYYLMIGHKAALSDFDSAEIFKLYLPVKSAELVGSIRILAQLDERRIDEKLKPKHRTPEDQAIIDEAKEYLINERGMDEAKAHRFLQKRSMDLGTPVTEIARTILYNAD